MPSIVFEGPDYSGKTTLIKDLLSHLEFVDLIQEPGSSPLANAVRLSLKTFQAENPWSRQMIMHGARYDMLANHDWLMDNSRLYILDRYVPSTMVYGVTDGMPLDTIMDMLDVFPVPTPTLTFVMAPPFKYIEDRLDARGFDALEVSQERLYRVYQNYLDLYPYFPGKKVQITSPSRETALEEALAELQFDQTLTKFVV